MRKSIILSCLALSFSIFGYNCNANNSASNATSTSYSAKETVAPVATNSSEDDNLVLGKKFLAKNAKRKGVVTTKSGLQYKIVKKGKGKKPTKENQVTVHYTGKLIDGTEFDSSIKRGEPITFGVTRVINGWIEALQMMPEGSEWIIYVPSELAYGSKSLGGIIPANSTLIFNIKLIKVI